MRQQESEEVRRFYVWLAGLKHGFLLIDDFHAVEICVDFLTFGAPGLGGREDPTRPAWVLKTLGPSVVAGQGIIPSELSVPFRHLPKQKTRWEIHQCPILGIFFSFTSLPFPHTQSLPLAASPSAAPPWHTWRHASQGGAERWSRGRSKRWGCHWKIWSPSWVQAPVLGTSSMASFLGEVFANCLAPFFWDYPACHGWCKELGPDGNGYFWEHEVFWTGFEGYITGGSLNDENEDWYKQ